MTVQGLPLIKPPYATISAISLDRGEIVWQIAHGETPDAIRNNAALKGLDIPRTGQSGYNIGTLVTKSLVIAGDSLITTSTSGARGAMLRAYDKTNGKEVGVADVVASFQRIFKISGPTAGSFYNGIVGADARPNWKEQPPRKTLTGVQLKRTSDIAKQGQCQTHPGDGTARPGAFHHSVARLLAGRSRSRGVVHARVEF